MDITYHSSTRHSRKYITDILLWHIENRHAESTIAINLPLDWEWPQNEAHLIIQKVLKLYNQVDYTKSTDNLYVTLEFRNF